MEISNNYRTRTWTWSCYSDRNIMTSKNYFFESNYTFRPLISITAAIIMSQMLLNCDNGRMFADLSMLVSTDKKKEEG